MFINKLGTTSRGCRARNLKEKEFEREGYDDQRGPFRSPCEFFLIFKLCSKPYSGRSQSLENVVDDVSARRFHTNDQLNLRVPGIITRTCQRDPPQCRRSKALCWKSDFSVAILVAPLKKSLSRR